MSNNSGNMDALNNVLEKHRALLAFLATHLPHYHRPHDFGEARRESRWTCWNYGHSLYVEPGDGTTYAFTHDAYSAIHEINSVAGFDVVLATRAAWEKPGTAELLDCYFEQLAQNEEFQLWRASREYTISASHFNYIYERSEILADSFGFFANGEGFHVFGQCAVYRQLRFIEDGRIFTYLKRSGDADGSVTCFVSFVIDENEGARPMNVWRMSSEMIEKAANLLSHKSREVENIFSSPRALL